MHKRICFCFALFFGLASLAQAVEPLPSTIEFTAQEKAYLSSNPAVKMCVDPDWVPFERINEKGEHEGIAADLVQLVAKKIGLKIELFPVKSWEESLAASKEQRCQIMSFLNQTPARDKWLIYTDPIFFDSNVIITREEHPFVSDLAALLDERVAIPLGTSIEERIRKDYPDLRIIVTDTEQDAINLVSERKADMTIRSLIVAAYTIKKQGLFNLKIAGQIPEYSNKLRIGVLKNEVVLRDILNKGVSTLSPHDRETISNKHVSINVQQGFDRSLIWKILLAGSLIPLWFFYWNRKLSKLNKELERLSVTDKLTGLYNRVKLDSVFEKEIQRAERFKQPFSIIMVDVDHFKQVNDTYGHQVGDQVLIDVAKVLLKNTRDIDLLGRWGGEEFMIICPQTDLSGGLKLAEHLREKLHSHDFPVIKNKTASFGVTSHKSGDQTKDMVSRADAALYAAKLEGRNIVKSM